MITVCIQCIYYFYKDNKFKFKLFGLSFVDKVIRFLWNTKLII